MRFALTVLLVAALYAVLGRAGMFLSVPPSHGPVVYPAAGFAVFILTFWPTLWPSIALGSLALNCSVLQQSPHGVVFALIISAAVTVQGLLAARLARSIRAGDHGHLRGHWMFVGVLWAMLYCLISSVTGTAAMVWLGMKPFEQAAISISAWWLGDLSGIVLLTPLMFDWWPIVSQQTMKRVAAWRVTQHDLEAIAGIVAVCAVAKLIWGGIIPDYWPPFLLLPFLVWLATKQERKYVTLGLLASTLICLHGTAYGHGSFGAPLNAERLTILQCFLLTNAICVLATAGVAYDRNEAIAMLKHQSDAMEHLARERADRIVEIEMAQHKREESAREWIMKNEREAKALSEDILHTQSTGLAVIMALKEMEVEGKL